MSNNRTYRENAKRAQAEIQQFLTDGGNPYDMNMYERTVYRKGRLVAEGYGGAFNYYLGQARMEWDDQSCFDIPAIEEASK